MYREELMSVKTDFQLDFSHSELIKSQLENDACIDEARIVDCFSDSTCKDEGTKGCEALTRSLTRSPHDFAIMVIMAHEIFKRKHFQ